ncbi:hypothetical protein [Tumebacillus lipolyticus]|uniref:Uncharacterized protein n=1 Tax=Tumebacillus lipolyticus TaxID=1280370 RepID=A0ABW4ZS43_9BACL
MAERGRDEVFTIIETHPEEGPTIEEIMDTLHDWFYGLLVTGELRRHGGIKGKLLPSEQELQDME